MTRPTKKPGDVDKPARPRLVLRRFRVPTNLVLCLLPVPAPNPSHPLAGLEPKVRNEQRGYLLSGILARLAAGRSRSDCRSLE